MQFGQFRLAQDSPKDEPHYATTVPDKRSSLGGAKQHTLFLMSQILRHGCDSCWLGSDEPEAHSTEEKPEMPTHSSEEAQ